MSSFEDQHRRWVSGISRSRDRLLRSEATILSIALLLMGALVLGSARPAGATWSIIAVDVETQEVVFASASCVSDVDLRAWVPVVVTGKGAAAAQAFGDVDGSRRLTIWNGLHAGWTAQEIIDELVVTQAPAIRNQQHGVAEGTHATSATHTGALVHEYASGLTGSFGSVTYAIQGGIITGGPVLTMAEFALLKDSGDLPTRVMAAMEAARSMGGDGRCSCSPTDPTGCGSPPAGFVKSSHVGCMIVARFGDTDDPVCTEVGCADGDYYMDLNVAFQSVLDLDPVFQLQTLFDLARQDLIARPDAIASDVSFAESRGSGDEWMMRVELRDWREVLLGHSIPTFTVEHAPESDQVTTIGSITNLGDGSYEVTLTKNGMYGTDVFHVTADDGSRPVILPPRRTTLILAAPIFADGFESGDTTRWSAP